MLGIIGAMPEEVELLHEAMEDKKKFRRAGLGIYKGVIKGIPVVVTCAGVGKVNAAMCAQILISEFGVTTLINTGVAGGVAPGVHVGDVVISTDAMYHDFDTTALGTPLGQIAYMENSVFPADPKLREMAVRACRGCSRIMPAMKGALSAGISLFRGKKSKHGSMKPLTPAVRRWRARPLPMWRTAIKCRF